MTPVTELFIIEDHPIYIEGIKNVFDVKADKIFVGGWATSAEEAREKLKTSNADVILLDLNLPGESGVDFCIEIKSDYKNKKVIALTAETDTEILFNVWMNKVDAIIMKLSGKDILIDTIHSVLKGKREIGKDVPPFFDLSGSQKFSNRPILTKREYQVLNLLISGNIRKEVAEKLNVTIDTVDTHCKNMFKKFEVNSLQQLLTELKSLKLIH